MTAIELRRASTRDAPVLAALAADHARYERLPAPPADHRKRLADLLACDAPSLIAWLAIDGGTDEALGYASFTTDVATLSGDRYGHLDCLYVTASARGVGIGARLFACVADHAAALGLARLEWQTPGWNDGARRFYLREGAQGSEKIRFALTLAERRGAGTRQAGQPPMSAPMTTL